MARGPNFGSGFGPTQPYKQKARWFGPICSYNSVTFRFSSITAMFGWVMQERGEYMAGALTDYLATTCKLQHLAPLKITAVFQRKFPRDCRYFRRFLVKTCVILASCWLDVDAWFSHLTTRDSLCVCWFTAWEAQFDLLLHTQLEKYSAPDYTSKMSTYSVFLKNVRVYKIDIIR